LKEGRTPNPTNSAQLAKSKTNNKNKAEEGKETTQNTCNPYPHNKQRQTVRRRKITTERRTTNQAASENL